jgi:uncharacterized protein (TIGR03437 family)
MRTMADPRRRRKFSSVRALALDASGQLYIADDKAGVVRQVDTAGVIMTLVGTGTPGEGGEGVPANRTPLNSPTALALDRDGNLLIAEAKSNRVRMVDSRGLIRTIAGVGAAGHAGDYGLAGNAQLTSPQCLGITPTGSLRICDSERIRSLIPIAPERFILPILNPILAGFTHFAPGSWLTLLGAFPDVPVTDWSNAIGADGSLPTLLAGVAVEVGGKPCVIGYVSPDRIDLLLPQDLPTASYSLGLALPGGRSTLGSFLIGGQSPEFLSRSFNSKLYAAATTPDGDWLTSEQPARHGATIRLYATGLNIAAATVPPYDSLLPSSIQVAVRSYGYPALLARPFSPGVSEITVRLPADLTPGDLPIRLFAGGSLSRAPIVLPVQ